MNDDQTKDARYFVADVRSIKKLVDTLAIDRFVKAGCRIDTVEVIDDSIRIGVAWEGVGDVTLSLHRNGTGPSFASTDRISLRFDSGAISHPYELLARRILKSLGDLTIEDIAQPIVGNSPVATQVDEPSPINSWGPEEGWREFLCDHAMERKLFETFAFDGPSSFIVHGDIECKFITPRARVNLPRFFNYPFKLSGDSEGADPMTDMQDLDVISGGETRLVEAIEAELADHRDRGPLIINATCVPVIIGDDVDNVMARYRDRFGHGLYALSPRTPDPIDIFMKYLDLARNAWVAGGRKFKPGTVALIGFRDDPARAELIELLRQAGIEVTGCVLPLAGETLMDRALDAELFVFRPSTFHDELYTRLFGDIERARISPPAPWGPSGTVAWLSEIGRALSRQDQISAVIARLDSADGELWLKNQSSASKSTLAFVIDPHPPRRAGENLALTRRLTDPLSITGLPILPVVLDMGFRVKVAVYARQPAVFRDFRDRLSQETSGHGKVEIVPFDDEVSLHDALGDDRIVAVFSEYFYDDRVTRLGKAVFSAQEFEMGWQGGLRSAKRLLRLAQIPFYRKWSRHLRSPSSTWWW